MVVNMMNNLSIDIFVYGLFNKIKPSSMSREQFSSWLSGFIDGEGNFQVYLDRNYLRVMFRIRLHIDDVAVLHKVRDFLGAGRVVIDGNCCVFIISEVDSLLNVLFLLFDRYKLYTTKWLDYIDFKSVVSILVFSNTTRLSSSQLERVKYIMSNMNIQRKIYNYDLIPAIIVNPFWFLGFIEGEGTFGFKNLGPYFQIGQNIRNSMVLDAIVNYLQLLLRTKSFTFSQQFKIPQVHKTLNSRTSVSVISIVNIDALYDYLMFFLLNMPFQTRKAEDFYFWSLALHLHKFGYFYLLEGRILVYKISQYINKGRYSTNPNRFLPISLSDINQVLDLKLPVRLKPEMSHTDLAKTFALIFNKQSIWVYDNGILLNEKAFTSITAAMEAIGYSKTSIAARRSGEVSI